MVCGEEIINVKVKVCTEYDEDDERTKYALCTMQAAAGRRQPFHTVTTVQTLLEIRTMWYIE